jgi:hypothetical protein
MGVEGELEIVRKRVVPMIVQVVHNENMAGLLGKIFFTLMIQRVCA